jgi:hypothetical protein
MSPYDYTAICTFRRALEYSIVDGLVRIDDIVKAAAKDGRPRWR